MNARTLRSLASLTACCVALLTPPLQAAPPAETLTVCSYSVADLVVPIPTCCPANSEKVATLEEHLKSLIVQTLAPTSWRQNGGRGLIDYAPLSMALVVHQTPAVHAEVAELLASLRRMQDVQVALEVRFVTVSDDFCERVGVNSAAPCLGCASGPNPGRFLNDKQVHHLLEAAQGDRRTNVMQAPKMTLINAQTGTISLPEFRLTAQPVVSADRRFVRVFLKVDPTEASDRQAKLTALQSTVAIPDGGTVLLGGLKTVTETRTECGSPVLSKIPCVNRLFKKVGDGRGTESLLVMVTPRVIVQEAEEAPVVASEATASTESATQSRPEKMVAELLRACEAACAAGRHEEAGRYAQAALAIDPTCLRKGSPRR